MWLCGMFIQKMPSHMFNDCKFSHISVIHLALTLNYDSQHQRSEVEAALTEGHWPHGPLAKMYHSVVSWIIEQQKCNFRDQCSMPTLFPFQSERLIIHICCAFRLLSDSLLGLKLFSKTVTKWKPIIWQKLETLVNHVPALCGCCCCFFVHISTAAFSYN